MSSGFIPPKLQPPPTPQLARPHSHRRVPVVLFALLILVGICAGALYFFTDKDEVLPPNFSSGTNSIDRPRSTTATVSATKVPIAPLPTTNPIRLIIASESKAEIETFLDSWSNAINENDEKAVGTMFDAPRDYEEMRNLGVLDKYTEKTFARLVETFAPKNGKMICGDPLLHFRGSKIGRIYILSDPTEFLVYSRAWNLELKRESDYRWWLRKSGLLWRIYDYQCLDGINLRVSRIFAFVVGAIPENGPAWCDGYYGFRNVIKACNQHDNEAILRSLNELQKHQFPAEYGAILLATRGSAVSQNNRLEAIRLFAEARVKYPDYPSIYLAQADVFWHIKQFESAVQAIKAYLDLTGDNAFVCEKLGNLYEELHKPGNAAQAYQRGLLCDPNSRGNREGLARVNH